MGTSASATPQSRGSSRMRDRELRTAKEAKAAAGELRGFRAQEDADPPGADYYATREAGRSYSSPQNGG
jgi:hypothetical protein